MNPMLLRLLSLVLLLVLTGCTSSTTNSPDAADQSNESRSPTTSNEPVPEPEQARPEVGQCHRLSAKAAVAPTNTSRPVACRKDHTAQTFHVGDLDLIRGTKTLAVDAPAVQGQPATVCPRRLPAHLKITPRQMRLTMARAVWFTPTISDAELGATWFRCDVVVVTASDVLMRLPPRTAGSGSLPALAMCATAEPGTPGFERVACSRKHSWRAVASVDLPGKVLPGPDAASSRMELVCREAARTRAADQLDFNWSEERPTKAQWAAGQRYGICWVPTSA